MSTLTGRKPKETYPWLLQAGAGGALTGTPRDICLGDGSTTPLSLTSTSLLVGGGIAITTAAGQVLNSSEQNQARINIGAANILAVKHPNALQNFALLRNQLRLNRSVDIVVVGDSTGDGTTRWPRQLAQKLALAYPGHNVVFKNVTQNSGKAWNTEAIQTVAGSSEPRHYWPPASGISAWSAGSYAAGTFVTYAGATWFSLVDSNTETPNELTTTKWLKSPAVAQVRLSGEDVPYMHGDGTVTTTKVLEMELEYTMRYLTNNTLIFSKEAATPVDATKGFIRLYQHQKLFQFHWGDTVGSSVAAYSGYTTGQLPVADGVRLRLRVTFTPNNGTNRTIVWAYSTWNGSTWSAYTTHQTMTQATTQWVIPQGPINVNMAENSIFYGATIRSAAGGKVECDFSVDQYTGYGIKNHCYLGTPTITIWNYAWSGLEMSHFLGIYPLTGSTYVNYDLDFTPRNTCAFICNVGHNAHGISSGKQEATQHVTLQGIAQARFPRAAYFAVGQNPGIDARANGTPGQYLDYSMYNGMKEAKQSLVMAEAIKRNWGFIDINRVFREHPDTESLITDGLHPNPDGSDVWSDETLSLIEG